MNFDEKFDNLQNEKIDGTDYYLKDFFDDDKILFNIQENREFFRDIPIDDLDNVLEKLLYLILDLSKLKDKKEFDNLEKKFYRLVPNNINTEEFKRKTRKATYNINEDLKTIRKYTYMLINKFGASKEDFYPNNYFLIGSIPSEIKEIIKMNIKIIDDLEKEKFEIIKKDHYYSYHEENKNKITLYLKEVRTKYKLKSVSKVEKNLISSLFN